MITEDFRRWLDITEQQLELLQTVFHLEKDGKLVTPKNIDITYAETYKKLLQKPNLFNQLNALMDKGIIVRTSKARYSTDVEKIKYILIKRTDLLKEDLVECEKAAAQLNKIKQALNKPASTSVKYFNSQQIFLELAKTLRTAKSFDMIAGFPGIAFTHNIYSFGERGEYWRALLDGLKNGRLKIRYLTNLDINYPLLYAYKLNKNKTLALRESLDTINNLEILIKQYKNIGVAYALNDMSGLIIIERDNAPIMFQFLRDVNRDVIGGVMIESQQTIADCKLAFEKQFCEAEMINGAFGAKLLNGLRSRIKKDGLKLLKHFKT